MNQFIYDGWNLVREFVTDYSQTPTRTDSHTFLWGLALAGRYDGTLGQSAGLALHRAAGSGSGLALHRERRSEMTLIQQHKIASCLSSLDDLIAAERQKLDALKVHKKGLMQQLFPAPEEVGG